MNEMSETKGWEHPDNAQSYTDPSDLPLCISKILWPQLTEYVFPQVLGDLKKKERALDAGCGDASYTHWFKTEGEFNHVVGIDNSEAMLFLASCSYLNQEGLEIEKADVLEYVSNNCKNSKYWDLDSKLKDSRFDFIFAGMLLCNLGPLKLSRFFRNSRENLREGGMLLTTNVADESLYTQRNDWLRHEFPEGVDFEGGALEVTLKTEQGNTLGPFPNFLWGSQEVKKIAEREGLRYEGSVLLSADLDTDPEFSAPLYEANIFRRA